MYCNGCLSLQENSYFTIDFTELNSMLPEHFHSSMHVLWLCHVRLEAKPSPTRYLVRLHVLFHVGLLRKGSAADDALEGLLSGVTAA